MAGWNNKSPSDSAEFLDRAVYDDFWALMLPELQVSVKLDQAGFDRLIQSLNFDKVPVWQFEYLCYGCITDTLSVSQIALLLNLLCKKEAAGVETAIKILRMVIHGANDEVGDRQLELQKYCIDFIEQLEWSLVEFTNHILQHDIVEIIKYGTSSNLNVTKIMRGMHNLITFVRKSSGSFMPRLGSLLEPYFEYYSLEALDTHS